jgi:hypothetical protein
MERAEHFHRFIETLTNPKEVSIGTSHRSNNRQKRKIEGGSNKKKTKSTILP